MNVGLIVVINSFESEILKTYFITVIKELTDVKLCFVNNGSSEHVHELLTEIAEQSKNAFVVSAKKKKSSNTAIRAGARFLVSQFNLKSIGFIIAPNEFKLLDLLKTYSCNRDTIMIFNQKELEKRSIKQTFYQRLFSVNVILEKLNSGAEIQSAL